MQLKIFAQPAVEPVSLQDTKEHLRLDSGNLADNLTTVQSIAPGSHGIHELMTLDMAPGGAGWAAGDTITGATSHETCTIVTVLTTKTYYVRNRLGAFTLGEVLSNGTATADQGAANPTFATGYYLVGASVDVLGLSAVVNLDAGTVGAGGTVEAKIQESDDNTTFTDWTGGAFTLVNAANDNAIQEKAYAGAKQYIRVIGRVLGAACEFGVQILKYSGDTTEDALLAALITAARQQAEAITQRQFITATWDAFLNAFPCKPFIPLPFGQLQSVTSLAYTDSAGTVTTMDVATDYLVDDDSDPGRIVLPYGVSWPSFTASPVNPIAIRYKCGYGDTAADVPAGIRTAIKMICEDLYNRRSATDTQQAGNVTENKAVLSLLWPYRLWSF